MWATLTKDCVGGLGSESQLSECRSEGALHLSLLVDKALERAGGCGVTSKVRVGLKSHFSNVLSRTLGQRRFDFSGVTAASTLDMCEMPCWYSGEVIESLTGSQHRV